LQSLLSALSSNLDHVDQLLSAGPIMVAGDDLTGRTAGALAAYDPTHHLIDLRSSFSPLAAGVLGALFTALGIPTPPAICLPVDVTCAPAAAQAQVQAQSQGAPAPVEGATAAEAPPRTPIDGILGLVATPSADVRGQPPAPMSNSGRGSWLKRTARRVLGVLA
jgi:hypothetical protein